MSVRIHVHVLTYVIESTYSVQNPCCYHIELESFPQY